MEHNPYRTVSVVVPTLGRPVLGDAVRSVLAQRRPPAEILLVHDPGQAERIRADAACRDPRVLLVCVAAGTTAAAKRMTGARAAVGDVVAFLDDDDLWSPDKLGIQCDLLDRAGPGRRPIVSCRAEVIDHAGRPLRVEPRASYPGGDLASYLFRQDSFHPNGFVLGSSTLLCDRTLLDREPMDERLRLHEDWEWVLRACRHDDVDLLMAPEPLISYRLSAPGTSASRLTGSGRASVAFADRVGLRPRERGDFLLAVPAAAAIARGERRTALGLARRAAAAGGRPGLPAWAAFVVHLLLPERPRRWLAAVARLRRAETWPL